MENETFFNIDFYRTILSVLIGGVISLSSVLLVEYFKNRKEKKEKKRIVYNNLITTINQLRRIELKGIQSGIGFSYQKRVFEIDNDEIAKQQAEYNQKLRDESINQIIEKAEVLDTYSIEYKILYGEDKTFDDIMYNINNWPRPKSPNYSEINSLTELNKQFDLDFKLTKKTTTKYWYESVEKINNHIYKKLI